MKYNKKAIGVVETFLAITVFSMVSFVSLQGYSSEAINAKVSSDLTSILRGIEVKVAEGYSQMAFVNENNKNRLTNLSLAGKKATKENYSVGNPNYTALGVRKDEFLDPSGKEYVIGATTTGGGRMEIAGVITIDGKKQTILRGNYDGRGTEKQEIETITGKVIVLKPTGTNFFRTGDYVKIGPVKYNIQKVARDGITIKLDKEVIGNFKKVGLVEAEGKSLISDYRDNTKNIEHNSTTTLPY